jgi:hypothetical protein
MRKLQVNLIAKYWIVLCALILAGGSTPIYAQMPGQHPAYLHAIRDLREARALLQYNFTNPAHIQAASSLTREINAAIRDLKNASHIDEKDLQTVPPNKDMPPEGRFHQIRDLLNTARSDAKGTETDPSAISSRDGGLHHIDEALSIVGGVI